MLCCRIFSKNGGRNPNAMNFAKRLIFLILFLATLHCRSQTPVQYLHRAVDWSKAAVGKYATVELSPKDQRSGFLVYKRTVNDCDVFALSDDTGSAGPTEAYFDLYIRRPSGRISCVLNFPLVNRNYSVKEESGILNIYCTAHQSSENKPVTAVPMVSIDPTQLSLAYKYQDSRTLDFGHDHKAPAR